MWSEHSREPGLSTVCGKDRGLGHSRPPSSPGKICLHKGNSES